MGSMSSPDDDASDLPHFEVLRLGHRPDRDKRITTHVALLSRAFGGKGIHIDTSDSKLEDTIKKVNDQFGGNFFIRTGQGRKGLIGKWNGTIVHLTMYGAPLDDIIHRIPKDEKILIIVGAEKVPRDVYENSHFNISVANQPHSEVSALALFIDRLCQGKQLKNCLRDPKVKVIPDLRGKNVIDTTKGENAVFNDPFSGIWPSVPDENQCMEIMESIGISGSVIDHVMCVHSLGIEMVTRSMKKDPSVEAKIDLKLLSAGLLLHDIGRSITHSIGHVDKGYHLAMEKGLDERICNMIRNHIGAGVTAEEAPNLGLEPIDHIPKDLMEKIICHADNLVGERSRRSLDTAVNRLVQKGAITAADRMKKLHLELEDLLGIDIDELVP